MGVVVDGVNGVSGVNRVNGVVGVNEVNGVNGVDGLNGVTRVHARPPILNNLIHPSIQAPQIPQLRSHLPARDTPPPLKPTSPGKLP